MFLALCAHHQEEKIVLCSIWYHHTCRWPSGTQVERGQAVLSQPVHWTATCRCDDIRCGIIQNLMWTALESNPDLRSDKPVTYTVHRDVLFIANYPYHLNSCQKCGIMSMHIICPSLQQNSKALRTCTRKSSLSPFFMIPKPRQGNNGIEP